MSNLGGDAMYKRPGRVDTFIKKMEEGSPFERVAGTPVVLKKDSKVIDSLKLNRSVATINLQTINGESIKFTQLKKSKEFGGGTGSGAGSEATDLNESAQAIFAAARWLNKKGNNLAGEMAYYNDQIFEEASKRFDVTSTIEEVKTLDDSWIQSSVKGAAKLFSLYRTKTYTFHRQSNWVKSLEKHWDKLNKEADKPFTDINKWSPADIYLVSDAGSRVDLLKTSNLVELNNIMLKNFKSKDIIGVSLKKITNQATSTAYNVGEARKVIQYVDYSLGKTGFFNAKDSYIFFTVDGSIQFRTFPTFQGEIKGKAASQGKISYGPIAKILREIAGSPPPNVNDSKRKIKSKDSDFLDNFYKMYKKLTRDSIKLDQSVFLEKLYEKDEEWILSKYLGTSLVNIIIDKKIENQFVSEAISYASSQSKLSGPFLKLE